MSVGKKEEPPFRMLDAGGGLHLDHIVDPPLAQAGAEWTRFAITGISNDPKYCRPRGEAGPPVGNPVPSMTQASGLAL